MAVFPFNDPAEIARAHGALAAAWDEVRPFIDHAERAAEYARLA